MNISVNTRPKSKIFGAPNTGPMTNRFLHSTQKIGSLDCPFEYSIFRVVQPKAGWLVCHRVKNDITLMKEDSGGRLAPQHMFRGGASTVL